MNKLNKEASKYITLKELAEMFSVPKVTVNYYALKGVLVPEFMAGPTNMYDRAKAVKVMTVVIKKRSKK